jgi:hypothetical protein
MGGKCQSSHVLSTTVNFSKYREFFWQVLTVFFLCQVGPRLAFFDAIAKAVGKIDIIAEDLVSYIPLSRFHAEFFEDPQ